MAPSLAYPPYHHPAGGGAGATVLTQHDADELDLPAYGGLADR